MAVDGNHPPPFTHCYCSAIMTANCSGKMSVWSRGRRPRTPEVFKAWGIALDILADGGQGGLRASLDGYPSPPHPVIPRRVGLDQSLPPYDGEASCISRAAGPSYLARATSK